MGMKIPTDGTEQRKWDADTENSKRDTGRRLSSPVDPFHLCGYRQMLGEMGEHRICEG